MKLTMTAALVAFAAGCRAKGDDVPGETGSGSSSEETARPKPSTADTSMTHGAESAGTASSSPTGDTGLASIIATETAETGGLSVETGDTALTRDTQSRDTAPSGWPDDTGDSGAGRSEDTGPCALDVPGASPSDTAVPAARRVGPFGVEAEAVASFAGEQGDTGVTLFYGVPILLGDGAGVDVEGLGDLNADGNADVGLGATRPENPAGGKAYFMNGPVVGYYDLSSSDATFEGADVVGISPAGDFDGDGSADVALAAASLDPISILSGASVAGALDPTSELLSVQGGNVYGPIASGDVDADGRDDLLVGDPTWSTTFPPDLLGRVNVVPGGSSGSVDPATFPDSVSGTLSYETIGTGLAAGDINGDGVAELLVGSFATPLLGLSYPGDVLVFDGPPSGSLTRADATSDLIGEISLEGAAYPLIAGDADADGNDDLLVYAPYYGGLAAPVGAAYLFYGPVPACGARLVSDAPAIFLGGFQAAIQVDHALGDFDGDGFDDLMILTDLGAVYVGYGPFEGTQEVMPGAGFGEFAESSYMRAAGAGDVDADGRDDIIIGDPLSDIGGGTGSGAAWILLGGF